MDAVIFDLFGTLVPNLEPTAWKRVVEEMAGALDADPAPFEEEWHKGFVARMDGTLPDGKAQFASILAALGLPVDAERMRRASEIRRRFMEDALAPRKSALTTLDALVERGLKLALATDCSTETPELLDRTPLGSYFSVRACSAALGVRKPDPAIYRHILEELGLQGRRCLYVGDGNSEELPGARRHGMITVWLDNGDEQYWEERFAPGGEYTIRELGELPGIVAEIRGEGDLREGTGG
ncbi:MAG: HAD family hydrolase [Planctomycetota bacterium]